MLPKLTTLLALCVTLHVHAQGTSETPAFVDTARLQAIRLYHRESGTAARIYTGMLRNNYLASIIGSPYFDTSIYVPANIRYADLYFEKIPVVYDMFAETLITLVPGNLGVQLQPAKTTAFDIGTHHFIRLDSGNALLPRAPSGFYEVLIEGKNISSYVRRKVILEEKITDRLEQRFTRVDRYHLIRGKQIDEYNTWRGLHRLLGMKRGQVRRLFNTAYIDPKTSPDAAIREILRYYDSQNAQQP